MTTSAIPPMPNRVLAIFKETAATHRVDLQSLFGESLRRDLVHARWASWARIITEIRIKGEPPSLPLIGRWSNRDHTSVLNGLRRHDSGLVWKKGENPGAYRYGRRPGHPPIRITLASQEAA